MISVIIPVYNREKTILEAVRSVLNQSRSDLEVIIVDDGSTDHTAEIIKKIDDNRVKYYYQKNSGACAARNLGIDAARGEFIAFHDSDDIWHADKLEKQLKAITEYGADIVFCLLNKIQRDGTVIHLPRNSETGFLRPVKTVMGIGTQTLLMRKKVLDKYRFDPDFPRLQELELLYRATEEYSLYCVNEGLVDYYVGDDSISASNEKLYKACCLMREKHSDLLERMPLLANELGTALTRMGIKECVNKNPEYEKYIIKAGELKKTWKMKVITVIYSVGLLRPFAPIYFKIQDHKK